VRFLLAGLVVVVLAFVVCAAVGAVILYRAFCHHDH
jgi:hypothetical protein